MLPVTSKGGGDTDDEIDDNYAGMVSCHFADSIKHDQWIFYSGASDHMTGLFSVLKNMSVCGSNPQINLPTGETSQITHRGNVNLKNNLDLKNVLHIPASKHSLLSVKKLCHDENCSVVFYDDYCIIQDKISSEVKGVGNGENGLYCLVNEPLQETLRNIIA